MTCAQLQRSTAQQGLAVTSPYYNCYIKKAFCYEQPLIVLIKYYFSVISLFHSCLK